MKNIILIFFILIILFKTGNVFSNENIFNVDNIEIDKERSKNSEKIVNQAFKEGFSKLINRLLLEKDYKKLSETNLVLIKELISHYQIADSEENVNKVIVNIYFDRERMHNFFYEKNIFYSDIVNTEVIIFPLLVIDKQYFIYSKNYFVENWNLDNSSEHIQYTLPIESIENIQKIEMYRNNILSINISDFFKEYNINNMVFAVIEVKNNIAKIFLNTKIGGKKLNKTLSVDRDNLNQIEFQDKIIISTKKTIKDLIKSQNLIDVRTPSFLNVKINLKNKRTFIEFDKRLKKIDLIDNFFVQQLSKDYVLVKIRYLGKINKIISELKDQKLNLKMIKGQWQLNLI